ncbi:hypothetical protein LYNGBM3L_11310 [Moorena producens 3L]|uniref:Uncharacterized protein n=1 Tax=Moorena producens 3L TaxID=489825 RepID=F4XKD4_9CYAN|nr:hypothetical protein LYNGBM3L_11310 [Moorena producens 3L]
MFTLVAQLPITLSRFFYRQSLLLTAHLVAQ